MNFWALCWVVVIRARFLFTTVAENFLQENHLYKNMFGVSALKKERRESNLSCAAL